jgi:hypothetical protein
MHDVAGHLRPQQYEADLGCVAMDHQQLILSAQEGTQVFDDPCDFLLLAWDTHPPVLGNK